MQFSAKAKSCRAQNVWGPSASWDKYGNKKCFFCTSCNNNEEEYYTNNTRLYLHIVQQILVFILFAVPIARYFFWYKLRWLCLKATAGRASCDTYSAKNEFPLGQCDNPCVCTSTVILIQYQLNRYWNYQGTRRTLHTLGLIEMFRLETLRHKDCRFDRPVSGKIFLHGLSEGWNPPLLLQLSPLQN